MEKLYGTALMRQVKMMLDNGHTPERQAREEGDNPGWDTPLGCLINARHKIGRVLSTDVRCIKMVGDDEAKVCEEMREAAHYLLRGASLLDLEMQLDGLADAIDKNSTHKKGGGR